MGSTAAPGREQRRATLIATIAISTAGARPVIAEECGYWTPSRMGIGLSQAMAYDSIRDVMLLQTGAPRHDLWELTGDTWRHAGDAPIFTGKRAMAFDQQRGTTLLLLGNGQIFARTAGGWAFYTAFPALTDGVSAAYDPLSAVTRFVAEDGGRASTGCDASSAPRCPIDTVAPAPNRPATGRTKNQNHPREPRKSAPPPAPKSARHKHGSEKTTPLSSRRCMPPKNRQPRCR